MPVHACSVTSVVSRESVGKTPKVTRTGSFHPRTENLSPCRGNQQPKLHLFGTLTRKLALSLLHSTIHFPCLPQAQLCLSLSHHLSNSHTGLLSVPYHHSAPSGQDSCTCGSLCQQGSSLFSFLNNPTSFSIQVRYHFTRKSFQSSLSQN